MLGALVAEADELDRRLVSLELRESTLGQRQRRLEQREAQLDADATRLHAVQAEQERRTAELARRERAAEDREHELATAAEAVRREQRQVGQRLQELDRRATELDLRERRFAQRWSRLIGSWWRRPRRLGAGARACELLFAPTPAGYELLPQEGLALARGARLRLPAQSGPFLVSKVAPWPFDERWCAYLQQD